MKSYLAFLLFIAIHFTGIAQEDSSAYQVQRKKVNQLLDERSAKFGQYDESLSKRTGIFGLKTKKDMQRSIDILTQIVQTDNNIFRELKILLDYKDLEKTQAQSQVGDTKPRLLNFMNTINKLQDQNDKLKADAEHSKSKSNRLLLVFIAFVLAVLAGVAWLYKRKKLTFS